MASYLTVTAHYFLENKNKLITRVLETKFLEISHTSENFQTTLTGKSMNKNWAVLSKSLPHRLK